MVGMSPCSAMSFFIARQLSKSSSSARIPEVGMSREARKQEALRRQISMVGIPRIFRRVAIDRVGIENTENLGHPLRYSTSRARIAFVSSTTFSIAPTPLKTSSSICRRPSTVLSAMSRLPALTWIFARTCDCIATIAPLRSPAFSATDLTIMTSSELQNLIVATLTRNAGGSRRRWRLVVGPVRVYSLGTHPHCNWSVAPSGSAGENAVVEDLIDTIRSAHPIVAAG
ncbi:hypothetical protein BHE75_02602 [Sphingomonas haloaromaticamans]|uniref:Uncharacterized protein n=2 Tax=Edaphosphingomonas haloaromaticamans TaxID=653954 RepID=A0A1S1HH94_9SPHN|nr:hypothetical protein BHE75_02602 [Sphingomonas haloaromaticamans]